MSDQLGHKFYGLYESLKAVDGAVRPPPPLLYGARSKPRDATSSCLKRRPAATLSTAL